MTTHPHRAVSEPEPWIRRAVGVLQERVFPAQIRLIDSSLSTVDSRWLCRDILPAA